MEQPHGLPECNGDIALAWRFRIQLPPDADTQPYTVRFVLDAADPVSQKGLHLIVNNRVIARPQSRNVSYSHTRRTDQNMTADQDEIEYFVRLANVAPDALLTADADFTLRVEVEGFYGEDTGPSGEAIATDLPPGFDIIGPDEKWSCSGGADVMCYSAPPCPAANRPPSA